MEEKMTRKFYQNIEDNRTTAFDKLVMSTTITQYRLMYVFAVAQLLTEVVMFFVYNGMGEIHTSTAEYLTFYLWIPTLINGIIILGCYLFLKNAKSVGFGTTVVSFGLLFLCGSLYFMHHVFDILIILFLVPLLLGCVYGSKGLTIGVGFAAIFLKWILDSIMYIGIWPHYVIEGEYDFVLVIMNEALYGVVMLVIILFCITIINVEKQKRTLTMELEQEKEDIDRDYQKEKLIRKSNNENKILEYVANVTDDCFSEGAEMFAPLFGGLEPAYRESMIKLIPMIVHPEDQNVFSDFSKEGYFEYMLTYSPKYMRRIRISAPRVLQALQLSEKSANMLRAKEGEWIYVNFNATIVADSKVGNVYLYVEIIDVDEKIKLEMERLDEASKDHLTGILNRKAGEEKILQDLEKDQQGVLFLLDLDGFKAVNDTFGHPEGDRVLIETASILEKSFRSSDVVCRLGGDEFMVYAPEMREDMAVLKARGIIEKCHRTITGTDKQEVTIGASIGIALFPKHGEAYEALYGVADKALYEAKNRGKGAYVVYEQ